VRVSVSENDYVGGVKVVSGEIFELYDEDSAKREFDSFVVQLSYFMEVMVKMLHTRLKF
jgi:hypothetical protein